MAAANVPDPMRREREHPRITSAPTIDRRFLKHVFKVKPCTLDDCEGPAKCLFKHPGEQAGRRDPNQFRYDWIPCPSYCRNGGGSCPRGGTCQLAHGVLESALHPGRPLALDFWSLLRSLENRVKACVVLPCERAAVQLILDLLWGTGQICEEYEDDDIVLYPSYNGTGNKMAIAHAEGDAMSKHGHDDLSKTIVGSIDGPKSLRSFSGPCKLVLPEFAGTCTGESSLQIIRIYIQLEGMTPLVCPVDASLMPGWGSAAVGPDHYGIHMVEPDNLKPDSGASYHVVGEKTFLHRYQSFVRPKYIHVADGHPLEVVGVGSLITPGQFFITKVHRVKKVKENLISVSQLARDHGLFVGFHGGICEIFKRDGEKVGGGFMQANGLYKLRFLEVPELADGAYENA